MTEIYLVRHAETIWHADNRYAGRTDVPLTDQGRRQAQTLGAWARHAHLDAIMSSPMQRTIETAKDAADQSDLSLETDQRIIEIDFGHAEGLTTADMRSRFPQELEAFHRDPVNNHLPGGEHPDDCLRRAMAALTELNVRFPQGSVLVVTHTTLIRLVLCRLLGIDISEYRRTFPSIRNVALTHVRLLDDTAALLALNSSLPPALAVT